ncbi:MAG: GatB/YqeY domain-containing protein [Candidatus Sumerlaeaceae bacterium]
MDIKAQIQKDRIDAMKAREADKKGVLDYILGEIQRKEKDPSAKGDVAVASISAYVKSLREFIDQHGAARPVEAAKYLSEIEILSVYLPKQLSDEEIGAAVLELQSTGENRKGMIMKALKEKHGAGLDGRRATALLDKMGIK